MLNSGLSMEGKGQRKMLLHGKNSSTPAKAVNRTASIRSGALLYSLPWLALFSVPRLNQISMNIFFPPSSPHYLLTTRSCMAFDIAKETSAIGYGVDRKNRQPCNQSRLRTTSNMEHRGTNTDMVRGDQKRWDLIVEQHHLALLL